MSTKLQITERHDVYDFIDPAKNLKGAAQAKRILITGAGTGIGRGIAQSFALAGAAELYLAARRVAPLQQTMDSIATLAPKCKVHVVGDIDISKPKSIENLFGFLGTPPDVIVNNAAISLHSDDVADSDPEIWEHEIQVNLIGTYRITRAYMRMLGNRPGRIINVSSNASWRYLRGKSSYSASKVALNNFCDHVDKERENFRCFAMHPGGVAGTDMSGNGTIPEYILPLLVDTPALPGGTAVYLSLPRSDFLGGRYVPATWDMQELETKKDLVLAEDLLKTGIIGIR